MYPMKKAVKILAILIVLILLAFWLFTNSLKPTYDGTIDIAELNTEVTVHYDNYGIPHIYSDNEIDAFTALGYVHAQDRLWQMELIRRIAPGRLSELFGKDLLKTDKFFVGLGINEASKKTVAELDKSSQSYKLTQAYLNGINQFIKEGSTPIEFYLTGINKEEFTITDVHNVLGYVAFSFAMAHKTDPLLTNIKNKLGQKYINDLNIYTKSESTKIYNFSKKDTLQVSSNLLSSIHTALDKLPLPLLEGSNSWVLAPEKTANGKVILANDPHIGFAQPSVWYEAHVKTPNYEMYGYHMAGMPFPFLGHNRKLAYGLTMFQNDDLNFYWEENHPTDPNKYKTPSGWKDYETRTETIKVKDGEDVTVTVKSTDHGPIMNGITDGIDFDQPVATYWIYTQLKNQVIEASYNMSHANNQKEFKSAVSKIHAPGLNVMYGDAENNIGWYAAGKLYELPEGSNSKHIMNGSDRKEEPIRFLEFSENPQATNPPWHYVYSANNQPDSIAGRLYPGYYLPENRAKRIVNLLEPKSNWTKEDVKTMINDVKSPINSETSKLITSLLENDNLSENQNKAIAILNDWNGDNQLDNIAPTIYNKFIYNYLKNSFLDELGEEQFKLLLKTHLLNRTTVSMLYDDQSIWFDDITTKNLKETRKTIINTSFNQTITDLEQQLGNDINSWTWNRVHTLEHEHPIGNVAALRKYFNVGPFDINGAKEVINNLTYYYDETGHYKVIAGPSTRRVIDFSDIENSMSILPTGQSGNMFSPFYKDQAELYNNGGFRKMLLNLEAIKEVSKNTLILK